VHVLGLPVTTLTLAEVVGLTEQAITRRDRLLVTTLNAHAAVTALKEPAFEAHFREADVVLPDGSSVAWAAGLVGRPEARRLRKISGLMCFEALARRGAERGWSFYFLGSTEAVLEGLERAVHTTYPGLVVAGLRVPPFGPIGDEENDAICRAVSASRADALFVGMTAPKQELWLSRNRHRLQVPVMMGIGAVFDYLAGTRRRPPEWAARGGLEWLFRLVQEPRRLLRRNLDSLAFASLVARDGVRSRRQRAR
jgi:N-acetylglucosaminyldiphosphoundecaprenol N-acetyl-beta-D-mannosaminyltransferase